MSEERFLRVIRLTLDDEPFSRLFDALVRSFPYQLPAGTDSVLDVDVDPPSGNSLASSSARPSALALSVRTVVPPCWCFRGRFHLTSS
jgi:hypothetical protein